MKITIRQLRRIIRESRADDEADRGWRDFHNGLERDISGSHWYQTGYDEAKENAANRRDTPPVMRETSKIAREEKGRTLKESSLDDGEYYEKQNASDPRHSLLDLDDYEALEDTVTVAIRNLVRAGYTKEDVAAALKLIVDDA